MGVRNSRMWTNCKVVHHSTFLPSRQLLKHERKPGKYDKGEEAVAP